ncbi:MAG: hypothetical protein ACLSD4_07695 [Bifidobacterium catenulatum]
MIMTIERSLHYEILNAMDEGGLLDRLVFQGGTSSVCAMAQNAIAGSDFSGGRDFDRKGLDTLKDRVEHAVVIAITSPSVKEPRQVKSLVAWTVIVDTTPKYKDVPRQRINRGSVDRGARSGHPSFEGEL